MMTLPHPSTANPILAAYTHRGFALRRDGGVLVVRPADRLTAADDGELRAWKPVLMTLRGCPVLGCGQLLPWGEATSHDCGDTPDISPSAMDRSAA